MIEVTDESFAAATARDDALIRGPHAESAHYDRERDRVIVRLSTGVEIGFAPRDAEGLQGAGYEDLAAVEVEAFGLGIHFPTLDADFYVPALPDGVLGSRRWMERRSRDAGQGVSLEMSASERAGAEPD